MKTVKRLTSLLLCLVLVLLVTTVIKVPSLANAVEPGSKGEIDVYLIAGQSNAVGYGENVDNAKYNKESIPEAATDSRYTEGFTDVLYYGVAENNVVSEFTPVKIGLGRIKDNVANSVGAEIGIAAAVSGTRNSAVIKYAIGGTPLTPANHASGSWTPPSYIEAKAVDTSNGLTGRLYNEFMRTVAEGVGKLVAQGYTPVLKGVWWMQGSAESGSSWRTEYATCLEYLIKDMRRDLGMIFNTDTTFMPFVAGSIRSNHQMVGETSPKYVSEINQAQLKVKAKMHAFEIVDTSPNGFPEVLTPENTAGLEDKYCQQDGWHFTAKAQHQLGKDFIERLRLIESQYHVSIETEDGVTYTGMGAYEVGDTVTLTFNTLGEFIIDKVTKQEGTASATSEDLTDGSLSFVMPSSNVKITVETTDTNPEIIPGLGSIPSYYPAEDYPFVLFKGNVLYDAYTGWSNVVSFGTRLGSEDGNNTLYLRRDYTSHALKENGVTIYTDDTQMLSHISGKLTIDLGGHTLTRGNAVLFRVMTKDGAEYSTELNITNGRINASGGAAIYISTHQNATKSHEFTLNFNGITFGIAPGATTKTLVAQTWSGNVTNSDITSDVSINLTNCTVDLKTVSPTSTITLFDLKEDVVDGVQSTFRKTAVTLTTSTVHANALADVKFFDTDDLDSFFSDKGSTITYTDGGEIKSTVISTLIPIETKYGLVTSDWMDKWQDVESYPFFIFKNGECVGAEKYWITWTDGTWQSATGALVTARTNASSAKDVVTILLRRNYVVSSSTNDDQWAAHASGTVNIDLNGYTITSGPKNSFLQDRNNQSASRAPVYNVYNGTVNIDKGFLIKAYSQLGTYTGKSMQFNFTNVNIGFVSGATQGTLVSSGAGASGVCNTTNITFTDCNFDFVTNAPSSVTFINMSASTANHKANIVINGGNIRVANYNKNFTMANLTAGYDTLKIGKGTDGKYTIIEINDYITTPKASLTSTGGEALNCFFLGRRITGSTATQMYTFFADSEGFNVEGYGVVPNEYSSADVYPFLIFQGGKFFTADTCWLSTSTGNDSGIYGVLLSVRKGDGDSDVLLRRDYEDTNGYADKYLGHLNATVNIDLGGHSITAATKNVHLFRPLAQYEDRYPVYNIFNGTLLVKNASIIEATASGKNLANGQTFVLHFENVHFGYAIGATASSIVFDSSSSSYSNTSNVTFKNCTFDLVTNTPSELRPFDLDNNEANTVNVTFVGCKIFAKDWDGIITKNGKDSLSFARLNGKYVTLELPKGTDAPTGAYTGEAGSIIVFTKSYTTSSTDAYELRIEAVAKADFNLKTSITLASNLILNVYVPLVDGLVSFGYDGNTSYPDGISSEYTVITLGDGKQYARIPIEFNAGEAARCFVFEAVINIDGTGYKGKWSISILSYASKLLNDDNATDIEKTLAKDILAYIRSAYVYFNTDVTNPKEIAEIDKLLGSYISDVTIDVNGAREMTEGLSRATLRLEATPTICFYLDGTYTADRFNFKVGNRALTPHDMIIGTDADGDYIQFSLYAYEMTEIFSYEISGTDVRGEYNIISYFAYASGNGENDYNEDNKAELVDVVKKFYVYSVSARAYRDAVVQYGDK